MLTRNHYSGPITSPPTLYESDWIAILKLSTRWFCDQHRREALRHIEPSSLSNARLVQLGRECYVVPWVRRGLYDLADSTEFLGPSKVNALTADTVLSIYAIRERKHLQEDRNNSVSRWDEEYEEMFFGNLKFMDVRSDVDYVFREEFDRLWADSAVFSPYFCAIPALTLKRKLTEEEGHDTLTGLVVRPAQCRKFVHDTAGYLSSLLNVYP